MPSLFSSQFQKINFFQIMFSCKFHFFFLSVTTKNEIPNSYMEYKSEQICFYLISGKNNCRVEEIPVCLSISGHFLCLQVNMHLGLPAHFFLFLSFLSPFLFYLNRQYALVCSSSRAAWYRMDLNRTVLMPLLQVFLFRDTQGYWLSEGRNQG